MDNNKNNNNELHLRYFSPREMANLHGLSCQLYFTIGNSISVDVVAVLMRHLLRD